MIALRNVLVATDFSEPSSAALRYGIEFADKHGATLHVLHVVDDLAAHTTMVRGMALETDALQTALEVNAQANLSALVPEADRCGVRMILHVTTSSLPAQAILSYARDAKIDLIIVGTHGRRGLPYFFMGSVAQQVSRRADCPVLTVRAHERDFVVPSPANSLTELTLTAH